MTIAVPFSGGSSSSASPREYLALCRARDGVAALVATWRARRFRRVYQHLHLQAMRIQTWWRGLHGYATNRTQPARIVNSDGLDMPLAGSAPPWHPLDTDAACDETPAHVAFVLMNSCGITVEDPVGVESNAVGSVQDIGAGQEVEEGIVGDEKSEPHPLVIALGTYARTLQRWWRQLLDVRAARTRRTRTAARSFLRRAQAEAAREEAEAAALRASRRAAAQRRRTLAFVQAWCRGRRVRRALARARAAVVVLQSRMRGILARRVLDVLRTASAHRQAAASTVIQACWRRAATQGRFLRFRRATVAVQSHIRRRRVRRALLSAVTAARTLQRWYRGCMERRAPTPLSRWRACVMILQARHRGAAVRRALARGRVAVVVLQSRLRGWLAREAAARANTACTRVQLWWRRRHASHLLLRAPIRAWRRAFAVLQARWRRTMAVRRHARVRHGFIRAQACWRRFARVRWFRAVRCAVVTIQRWVRRVADLGGAQRDAAATRLQAWARTRVARTAYLRLRRACIRVQSLWRALVTQAAFLRLQAAAITIQAWSRFLLTWARYIVFRMTTIKVQAAYRARVARRRYCLLVRGATVSLTAGVHALSIVVYRCACVCVLWIRVWCAMTCPAHDCNPVAPR